MPRIPWSLLSLDERRDALRSYFAEPDLTAIAQEDAITVSWAINDASFADRDYDRVGSRLRAEIGA